jgi:hypothetical protein
MCRSIKKLRNNEAAATPQEVEEAALQFVRKFSASRVPAPNKEEAFAAAVAAGTSATATLLAEMDHPAQGVARP